MDKCDYEPLSLCLKINNGKSSMLIIGDRNKCLKEWNEFKEKCSAKKSINLKESIYIKRDEQPLMLYHY